MYNIDIFIISYEEQNLFCFPRFVRFPKCFKAQKIFFDIYYWVVKRKLNRKPFTLISLRILKENKRTHLKWNYQRTSPKDKEMIKFFVKSDDEHTLYRIN